MAHTPGPWVAQEDRGSAALFIYSEARELAVARVSDSIISQEDRANAALITTAPELLAELRHARRMLDEFIVLAPAERELALRGRLKSIDAAIRKAVEPV